MPKRKAEDRAEIPPDLDKLLQAALCYYCNRHFPDIKILQDHMKKKHLFCTHCGKKLDSLNGLRVHCESVHKMPLDHLPGAIEGRDDVGPSAPEVYLMEGVPEDMKEDFYRGIREEHARMVYEYRMVTGNYPPGTKEAAQEEAERAAKKQKTQETPEQFKARKAAHIAQKRAEKAAREAAKKNGDVVMKDEPKDDFASQQEHVALEPYVKAEPGVPTNNYFSGMGMGGAAMPQAPQGYGFGAGGPQYGYPPANYGQPTFPTPQFTHPQPIVGYGGSPQGFPQQPMAPFNSFSPPSHHYSTVKTEPGASIKNEPGATIKTEPGVGTNGKGSITAAPPGLPQRPAFDTPSFSKHDMAKFHHGQSAPRSQQVPASSDAEQARVAESMPAKASTVDDDTAAASRRELEASIDDLISSGKAEAEASNRAAEAAEAAGAIAAAAVKSPTAAEIAKSVPAKATSQTNFAYGDNHFMPEQDKSVSSKYQGGESTSFWQAYLPRSNSWRRYMCTSTPKKQQQQ